VKILDNTVKAVVTVGSLHYEKGIFSKGDIIQVNSEEQERLKGCIQLVTDDQAVAITEAQMEEKPLSKEHEKIVKGIPKNLKPTSPAKVYAPPAKTSATEEPVENMDDSEGTVTVEEVEPQPKKTKRARGK